MSSSILFLCASPAPAADILVAAAADLATLETPLTQAFQQATGHQARFVLGSSGMLARQIENGAPYDVFLSANEKFVQDLAASGKILPASVRVYADGRIAFWSKSGAYRVLPDLKRARRIAIPNPAHAPYGVAARQAIEHAGLWKELESRIVYAENVRQTLQFAESGNADVAITAWSLIFDRGGVLVPSEMHAPIRQSGGRLAASTNAGPAQQFLDFLASPDGRALLSRFGLVPAGSAR